MANELPFSASRVKLNRARKFIAELESEQAAYAKEDPLSATAIANPEKLSVSVSWKGIGLVPGAIVGDAVHNMRTALDLMSSELARMNGKNDKDVYFPFSTTKDNLQDAIVKKGFNKTGADSVALLVKLAPYRGGNDALRALHDLDIEDKHTALIPSGIDMDFAIDVEVTVQEIGASMPIPIGSNNVHYSFPPNSFFSGRRIIETLKELVQLVDGVIEEFSRMVALRTSK